MPRGRPSKTASIAAQKAKQDAKRPPIFVFHCRDANHNIRIWDYRSAEVGQFGELEYDEFRELVRLLNKTSILKTIIMHHDDCDGYDEACNCPIIDKF